MKKFALFFLLAFPLYILLSSGCGTEQQIVINYAPVYVPQESGYKFNKITNELDGIYAVLEKDDRPNLTYRFFDVSKDETKIAFLSDQQKNGVWTRNIFLKKLSQLGIRQQRTFVKQVYDLAFSPDGQYIVFSQKRSGSLNLFMIGAEKGAKIQQITNSNSPSYSPVFSPDGKMIVFTELEVVGQKYDQTTDSYEDIYDWFLWSYNLEDGKLVQYGKGVNADFFPDGRRVVCVRDEDDAWGLWIFDLESGQEFNLITKTNYYLTLPAVSPDGKKIAFTAYYPAEIQGKERYTMDIFVINSDGTGLTQITFHPGYDLLPRWSKDGKSLYFLSQRGNKDGKYNIWKVEI